MTCYSIEHRDQILVKDYSFVSFAKKMGKNIGKNISKNLSGKYRQKLVDYIKQSAIDVLKLTPKRLI